MAIVRRGSGYKSTSWSDDGNDTKNTATNYVVVNECEMFYNAKGSIMPSV